MDIFTLNPHNFSHFGETGGHNMDFCGIKEASKNSLISRTDKVELIATEFSQQSCDCLGYFEQHTKSCKSYLVEKYIYIFNLKMINFMLKLAIEDYCLVIWTLLLQLF